MTFQNKLLTELVKYHDSWYRIALSFLGNKQDSEDVIQDMYLYLHKKNVELDKIRYKTEINRYFMFITIRNLCMNFLKKRNISVELNENMDSLSNEDVEDYLGVLIEKIDNESKTWHTYDRTLFEFYMYSGLSYRDISKGTDKKARLISNNKELKDDPVKRGSKISVSSIYTTMKICKQKLKEALGEDFEDYFNNDFDKI